MSHLSLHPSIPKPGISQCHTHAPRMGRFPCRWSRQDTYALLRMYLIIFLHLTCRRTSIVQHEARGVLAISCDIDEENSILFGVEHMLFRINPLLHAASTMTESTLTSRMCLVDPSCCPWGCVTSIKLVICDLGLDRDSRCRTSYWLQCRYGTSIICSQ
jgi:hypothetical protein